MQPESERIEAHAESPEQVRDQFFVNNFALNLFTQGLSKTEISARDAEPVQIGIQRLERNIDVQNLLAEFGEFVQFVWIAVAEAAG